ncbi:MAG: hypothetical protein RBR52_14695 [Thiomonas sp.]|nr:hypothetical protein [Thiomonas sp.]
MDADALPEWERVLSSAARLQRILPARRDRADHDLGHARPGWNKGNQTLWKP